MAFAPMIVIMIFQHELIHGRALSGLAARGQATDFVALEVPPSASHQEQNIANLLGSASNIVTATGPAISTSAGIS